MVAASLRRDVALRVDRSACTKQHAPTRGAHGTDARRRSWIPQEQATTAASPWQGMDCALRLQCQRCQSRGSHVQMGTRRRGPTRRKQAQQKDLSPPMDGRRRLSTRGGIAASPPTTPSTTATATPLRLEPVCGCGFTPKAHNVARETAPSAEFVPGEGAVCCLPRTPHLSNTA